MLPVWEVSSTRLLIEGKCSLSSEVRGNGIWRKKVYGLEVWENIYAMCRERKGHLGWGDGLEGKMRTWVRIPSRHDCYACHFSIGGKRQTGPWSFLTYQLRWNLVRDSVSEVSFDGSGNLTSFSGFCVCTFILLHTQIQVYTTHTYITHMEKIRKDIHKSLFEQDVSLNINWTIKI